MPVLYQMNRIYIKSLGIHANNIVLDDEWMQEDQWDEIYEQGENR